MEAPEPGCSLSTEMAEAWKSSVQHSPELHKEILCEIRKVASPDPTPERLIRVLTENIKILALTFFSRKTLLPCYSDWELLKLENNNYYIVEYSI